MPTLKLPAAVSDGAFLETVLRKAVQTPGIRIDREKFLRKELDKHFPAEVVQHAIAENPAQAGISPEQLEKIAKACITYETGKVSLISAAAGAPGLKFMAVTMPADLLQFFGHVVRVLQKLAYLYGWSELLFSDDELDDETKNQLILFLGVMFGVKAANKAVKKIALLAAQGVPDYLLRQTLTKGTIYPIVKHVSKIIGTKMSTKTFAKAVGSAMPVLGAAVSGGITFSLFRPMSVRLKKHLAGLPMADPAHYLSTPQREIIDIALDFSDIDLVEE